MTYNYIAIEGNIGAGKTTLARRLANQFKGNLVLEKFQSNPFLTLFYENPEKYSFQVETSFLIDRFRQLYFSLQNLDRLTISDYYFSKCLIFSKITLKDKDYRIYEHIYHKYQSVLPVPDLYVYLHSGVDRLIKNIHKRGRNYEQNIQKTYLEKIEHAYFEYFDRKTDQRILIININAKNFVNNPENYVNLSEIILNHAYKKGITRVDL